MLVQLVNENDAAFQKHPSSMRIDFKEGALDNTNDVQSQNDRSPNTMDWSWGRSDH